jgi:hypothetical protein
MNLRPPRLISRSRRERAAVAGAVVAYSEWHTEHVAASIAYRNWATAKAGDRQRAFDAFNAALDREERAAGLYARVIGRAEPPAERAVNRHSRAPIRPDAWSHVESW